MDLNWFEVESVSWLLTVFHWNFTCFSCFCCLFRLFVENFQAKQPNVPTGLFVRQQHLHCRRVSHTSVSIHENEEPEGSTGGSGEPAGKRTKHRTYQKEIVSSVLHVFAESFNAISLHSCVSNLQRDNPALDKPQRLFCQVVLWVVDTGPCTRSLEMCPEIPRTEPLHSQQKASKSTDYYQTHTKLYKGYQVDNDVWIWFSRLKS